MKMQATADWLVRYVRETCARSETRIEWRQGARDDASTLRTLAAVAHVMEGVTPAAAQARAAAEALLAACAPDGRLPDRSRGELARLTAMMEDGLA